MGGRRGRPTYSQVNVSIYGAETDTGSAAVGFGRWTCFLDDAGTFFNKGNYIVNVFADTDKAAVGWGFSFR